MRSWLLFWSHMEFMYSGGLLYAASQLPRWSVDWWLFMGLSAFWFLVACHDQTKAQAEAR